MQKTLLFSIFCGFYLINSLEYIEANPYSLLSQREFQNECKVVGKMCKNCKTLVFCIDNDGNFEESVIQNCPAGQSCLKDHCTDDPNPKCPVSGSEFTCTNTGFYPDPYDCSSYHVCVEEEDIITETNANPLYAALRCSENWGYNAKTTYCDIKLPEGFCPEEPPVPTCNEVGQMGPVIDTSIYYICVQTDGKLHPVLHMCPHGGKMTPEGICTNE